MTTVKRELNERIPALNGISRGPFRICLVVCLCVCLFCSKYCLFVFADCFTLRIVNIDHV